MTRAPPLRPDRCPALARPVRGLVWGPIWRLAIWLVLFLAWPAGLRAAEVGGDLPQPVPVLEWAAPRGIAASAAAGRWLAELERELADTAARCPGAALPPLAPGLPASAFRIPVAPERPVLYTRDSASSRLVVIVRDGRGCLWSGLAGRAWPSREGWMTGPLPNLRLPADVPAQEATVVIQDGKSIRPWLRVASTEGFVHDTHRLWFLLGGYTAILVVLLITGLGVLHLDPSPLARAYSFYALAVLIFQLQNLGIGSTWVPGWPQGEHFLTMQGVSLAVLVAGIGAAITAFLRPRGVLRLVIVGGVALACVAFAASGWYAAAYRVGALLMMLLAPAVLIQLVRGLKDREPWVRWFAVGLSANLIGGGIQAATVVFDGAGLGALGSFALPLGSLGESVAWLISLLARLRAERQRVREQLRFDATHDLLTGLPNRAALAVAGPAGTPGCRGAVLLDLDRFKAVNDSLGYSVGDDLLIAVARLLRATAPPAATVAHLGADTFVILLRGEGQDADAQWVAARIGERLREPIAVGSGSVHIRVSMGIVSAPAPGARIIDILRDADSALNLAKTGGGNRLVAFQPHMRVPAYQRFRLEQDLVEALGRGEFQVFFQPIVALKDRRTVGLEALIRWQRPEQGWLSPEHFIPVAEETGLIIPIGAWVLEHTARQVQDWKTRGQWRPGFYVSVNLSGHQMLDEALLGLIDAVIVRSGLAPGELRLELTETAVISNLDCASAVLPALRARQIPLVMDDFGTGYSSLSYLNELPFDVLKIDRSFVTGIETRQRSQDLVRTVLALAEAMGLGVIAEGIETEAQAQLLCAMGCPYGQGYVFARPLPAAAASAWLG